jgi:hypothetical protein
MSIEISIEMGKTVQSTLASIHYIYVCDVDTKLPVLLQIVLFM